MKNFGRVNFTVDGRNIKHECKLNEEVMLKQKPHIIFRVADITMISWNFES